jgi:hypothetical protein
VPLDHGDVEGRTFDEDVEAPEEFEPEPAPALDDEKAKKLFAALDAAYDRLKAAGGGEGARVHPPAKYRAWVQGAAHSHDELSRLLTYIESERDRIAGAGS